MHATDAEAGLVATEAAPAMIFSPQEEVALRRAWVAQLAAAMREQSPRDVVRLIAHRTAGAPSMIGLERYRARARSLQASEPSDADLEGVLAEVKRWVDEVDVGERGTAAASSPRERTSPSLRVLVVDDDPVQRAVVARRLIKQGHDVLLAEDGRQGLKLGLTERVDAILMDRVLPDIQGPRVLVMLRANGIKTPAALLTASAINDSVVGSAAVALVLEKPVSDEQLKAALADLVG